jgi:hypothetical protein
MKIEAMNPLFHKTTTLIAKADTFLDTVDESILVFSTGLQDYLSGDTAGFKRKLDHIFQLEEKADALRREIRTDLYQFSLIPEFRADISSLLEKLDDVVDRAKENLHIFAIEKPWVPESVGPEWIRLSKVSCKAAEALVLAARAFFREVKLVNDRLHRVYYFEREADEIAAQIKERIFQHMDEVHLSNKQQLRHFTNQIDNLANIAEDAADLLTILAIKRMV